MESCDKTSYLVSKRPPVTNAYMNHDAGTSYEKKDKMYR